MSFRQHLYGKAHKMKVFSPACSRGTTVTAACVLRAQPWPVTAEQRLALNDTKLSVKRMTIADWSKTSIEIISRWETVVGLTSCDDAYRWAGLCPLWGNSYDHSCYDHTRWRTSASSGRAWLWHLHATETHIICTQYRYAIFLRSWPEKTPDNLIISVISSSYFPAKWS